MNCGHHFMDSPLGVFMQCFSLFSRQTMQVAILTVFAFKSGKWFFCGQQVDISLCRVLQVRPARRHLAVYKQGDSDAQVDLCTPECSYGNSGIGPYQSQTQYLCADDGVIVHRKYSGNAFPLYFLCISTIFPVVACTRCSSGNKEETHFLFISTV